MTDPNYRDSMGYLQRISDMYGGYEGMDKKTSQIYNALEQLMFEHGSKTRFVEFIRDIHDNGSLDEFRTVKDLNTKYHLHGAPPLPLLLMLADASHKNHRKGGKRSHKHRKSHNKGGNKSHRKRSQRSKKSRRH